MQTRRFFLGAASLLALSIASRPALAGLHFHGTSSATGKSVLNSFSQYTDYPFMNFMKVANGLSLSSITPSELNADQYPKTSLTSTVSFTVPHPPSMAGPWVLKWTGQGSVVVLNSVNVSSISGVTGLSTGNNPSGFQADGTNGRIVFTYNTTPASTSFQFPSASPGYLNMANLVLCRQSDEASLTAGGIFLPEFLNIVASLNPKILRLMGWAVNSTDEVLSQYAYRVPSTAVSYFNNTVAPGAYVGTISGTNTYTCGGSPDTVGTTWVDGMMFQGKFTNANTGPGPWTIQPTGFTAKSIVGIDSSTLAAGDISAGQFATFVYDATLDKVLRQPTGIIGGPPIEIRVALCNALNKDYWHTFPFLYSDASIAAETAYIKANLNPPLNAYFEVSNEMWNPGPSNALNVAQNRAIALGVPNSGGRALYGGVGLRIRQIMGLVTTAWSGRGGLNRVCAWQVTDANATMSTYLLQGTDLSSIGGNNYSTVGNRPIDFCDALSYAPYYSGGQCRKTDSSYTAVTASELSDLTTQADNYAAGGSGITTALAWLDNDIRQGTRTPKVVSSVSSTTLTSNAHGFSNGQQVVFTTTSALYAGLSLNKIYFIVSSATNTFGVSATSGGAAISVSGGSGTNSVGITGVETLLANDTNYAGSWESLAATFSKTVICYEGGLQCVAPSTGACSTLGISPLYGGVGGKIDNLLTGYKNSAFGSAIVISQFQQFMGLPHSIYPAWLSLAAGEQWSLFPGDLFSTPYQTYFGMQTFNNT